MDDNLRKPVSRSASSGSIHKKQQTVLSKSSGSDPPLDRKRVTPIEKNLTKPKFDQSAYRQTNPRRSSPKHRALHSMTLSDASKENIKPSVQSQSKPRLAKPKDIAIKQSSCGFSRAASLIPEQNGRKCQPAHTNCPARCLHNPSVLLGKAVRGKSTETLKKRAGASTAKEPVSKMPSPFPVSKRRTPLEVPKTTPSHIRPIKNFTFSSSTVTNGAEVKHIPRAGRLPPSKNIRNPSTGLSQPIHQTEPSKDGIVNNSEITRRPIVSLIPTIPRLFQSARSSNRNRRDCHRNIAPWMNLVDAAVAESLTAETRNGEATSVLLTARQSLGTLALLLAGDAQTTHDSRERSASNVLKTASPTGAPVKLSSPLSLAQIMEHGLTPRPQKLADSDLDQHVLDPQTMLHRPSEHTPSLTVATGSNLLATATMRNSCQRIAFGGRTPRSRRFGSRRSLESDSIASRRCAFRGRAGKASAQLLRGEDHKRYSVSQENKCY